MINNAVIKNILNILYIILVVWLGYNVYANMYDFLSVALFMFSLFGLNIIMNVRRKEVLKVLLALYGTTIIIYYSYYPNKINELNIEKIVLIILAFVIILFMATILYFIPSLIVDYIENKNRKRNNSKR